MVGMGMIFDDTYRPFFEQLHAEGLYRRDFGLVEVELAAVASRTGSRAEQYARRPATASPPFASFAGPTRVGQLLAHGVDAVCVATPDDRHFDAARLALAAGKHVLIEKPSVLRCRNSTNSTRSRAKNNVLAKVVYHKLADPDHKKLRTHVVDGELQARQQRLLHAAGAEVDQRQPVRRVDHGPQSGHLRRRAITSS